MTHESRLRPLARCDGDLPFVAPRGARWAIALLSVVVSLSLVGAVVIGMTGEADGPQVALAAPGSVAQAPARARPAGDRLRACPVPCAWGGARHRAPGPLAGGQG